MLIKQPDLRAMLRNKLCDEGSFIRVPEGAEYGAEGATNGVLQTYPMLLLVSRSRAPMLMPRGMWGV